MHCHKPPDQLVLLSLVTDQLLAHPQCRPVPLLVPQPQPGSSISRSAAAAAPAGMTIQFVLLVNKQGQTRLARYTDSSLTTDERRALEAEIVRLCLTRVDKQASWGQPAPASGGLALLLPLCTSSIAGWAGHRYAGGAAAACAVVDGDGWDEVWNVGNNDVRGGCCGIA